MKTARSARKASTATASRTAAGPRGFDNGQKRWVGTYRRGRPDGFEKAWYRNGSKHYEGRYAGGKREGTFVFWYENGQKWFEGPYEGGVRQGMFRYWKRDGSFDEERSGFYSRGQRLPD